MTVEEGQAFLCIGIGIVFLAALVFVVWMQVDEWKLDNRLRERCRTCDKLNDCIHAIILGAKKL